MRKMHKLSKTVPNIVILVAFALIFSCLASFGCLLGLDQVSIKDFLMSFVCFFCGFLPLPGVLAVYVVIFNPNWRTKLYSLLAVVTCVSFGTFILLQAPFVKRTPDKEISIPKMI